MAFLEVLAKIYEHLWSTCHVLAIQLVISSFEILHTYFATLCRSDY